MVMSPDRALAVDYNPAPLPLLYIGWILKGNQMISRNDTHYTTPLIDQVGYTWTNQTAAFAIEA